MADRATTRTRIASQMFYPAWMPGVQGFVISGSPSSSELLKTFLKILSASFCDNANKQAQKNIDEGYYSSGVTSIPLDIFKFYRTPVIDGNLKAAKGSAVLFSVSYICPSHGQKHIMVNTEGP